MKATKEWDWLDLPPHHQGSVSSLLFVTKKIGSVGWIGRQHSRKGNPNDVIHDALEIKELIQLIWWEGESGRSSSERVGAVCRMSSYCLYPPHLSFSHCSCFVTGVGCVFIFAGKTQEGVNSGMNVHVCTFAADSANAYVCAQARGRGCFTLPALFQPPLILTHFLFPARRSLFNCRTAHWGHLLGWGPSPWRCCEAFRICCGLTNREMEVREWG